MAQNTTGDTSSQQEQQQDSGEGEPPNAVEERSAGTPSTSGRSPQDTDGGDAPRGPPLRRQGSLRAPSLGRTQQPSGVRKVRGPHNAGKSASAPVREPGPARQVLREHQSGPAGVSPAMVAINSLRAGVLPADRQVREKIAAAAQRVLAARGLQRRRSSEAALAMNQGLPASASAPSFSSAQSALHTSPSGKLLELAEASEQEPQPPSSVFVPHQQEGSRNASGVTASISMPHLPIMKVGAAGPQPISLATATALARGEPLSMMPIQPAAGVPDLFTSAANFHRPALRPASLSGGGGLPSGYRPFVVTTGTPRFAPEPPSRPASRPAWPSTPSPLRSQPLGAEPSVSFPPGTTAEALLTLADLSSSHGPDSSTYG